jgi:undecaprenyl phosphate-alpha-L-ara4FN deformylase
LLGRPEYPEELIPGHYLALLRPGITNVLTVHAELEGMKHLSLFRTFLGKLKDHPVGIIKLEDVARELYKNPLSIPICDLIQGSIDGRSGTLAVQSCGNN